MKKTVITIETFQRTTIRSRKAARFVRCEQCAADAPGKPAAQLETRVSGVRLTEADEINYSENESGGLIVCRHSA